MSETLHFAEHRLQEVALALMAIVYLTRLLWLFRFRAGGDRQPPTGLLGRTTAAKGAAYSLLNIAMPWGMESTRRQPFLYAQFVAFHLAVTANIALSFIIPYAPGVLMRPVVLLLQVVIALGFAVGVLRLIRRVKEPVMRAISTPDDLFSLALLTAWFAAGVWAAPNDAAGGDTHLLAYFVMTAFFLVYVPFSKISHYLYYPFTRYWLGRTLGYRGVYTLESGHSAAAGRGR